MDAGTGTMKSGGGGILRRHSADSRQLPTADSEDATTTNPGGSKDISTSQTDKCSVRFSDEKELASRSKMTNELQAGSAAEKVRFSYEKNAINSTLQEEDEDYSASISAILQRKASSRRGKRRLSSPFSHEDFSDHSSARRRSSGFTTTSNEENGMSGEESQRVTQEQIYENIRLHKEVITSCKLQPWSMRRKLKLVQQAKAYVKKHEGELQVRLKHSRSTRDILARFNIVLIKKWQHTKREMANTMNVLIPWELRIKEVESHFGSVVASYFIFLRWLFWVNLVISTVLAAFVITPEMLLLKHADTGERKRPLEEEMSSKLDTFLNFDGVIKYSPLFYGYYSNKQSEYRLPTVYFIVGLAVYVYSFVATLRKMAINFRLSKLSEKEDECIFTWKLFTGWDYMIGNAETAHNRTSSIVLSFKEALLEEAEKKKEKQSWKIITLRIFVNINVIWMLACSAMAVVYVVHRTADSKANEEESLIMKLWHQNELSIVMAAVGNVFPMVFEIFGFLERYHPRKTLRIQLARIMALNLLNLYTMTISLFVQINGMTKDLQQMKMEIENSTILRANISNSSYANLPHTVIRNLQKRSTNNFTEEISPVLENVLRNSGYYSDENNPFFYNIRNDLTNNNNNSNNNNNNNNGSGNYYENAKISSSIYGTIKTVTIANLIGTANITTTPPSTKTKASLSKEQIFLQHLFTDQAKPFEKLRHQRTFTESYTDQYLSGSYTETTNPSTNGETILDWIVATQKEEEKIDSSTDSSSIQEDDFDTTNPMITSTDDYDTGTAAGVITNPTTESVAKIAITTKNRTEYIDVTDINVNFTMPAIWAEQSTSSGDEGLSTYANENVSSQTFSEQGQFFTITDEDLITPRTTITTEPEIWTRSRPSTATEPETGTGTSTATEPETGIGTSTETEPATILTLLSLATSTPLDTNRTTIDASTTVVTPNLSSTISSSSSDGTTTSQLETYSFPPSTDRTTITDDHRKEPTTPITSTENVSTTTEKENPSTSTVSTKLTNDDTTSVDFGSKMSTSPVGDKSDATVHHSETTVSATTTMATTGLQCSTSAAEMDRPADDEYVLSEKVRMLDTKTRLKLRKLCWETMFGQELVKITVMDLVTTIGSTFFMDFIRALLVRYMNKCWCWDLEKKFPKYGDFKIAENILHLVNNQGLVWMGMFFSPGLPLINTVKLVIMMYLRSWAVLTCNVPHEVVFRASRSNNFYLALLLTMLFLCILPVGYAIVWMEPSWHCGPFSNYKKIYFVFTRSLKQLVPESFRHIIDYIASPGTVIPLLLILLLVIYYLASLTSALREANNDLKVQLRRERTEERKKMFQMANRRRRGGSEVDSTFDKWRKILQDVPSGKHSVEDASPLPDEQNYAGRRSDKKDKQNEDDTNSENGSLIHDEPVTRIPILKRLFRQKKQKSTSSNDNNNNASGSNKWGTLTKQLIEKRDSCQLDTKRNSSSSSNRDDSSVWSAENIPEIKISHAQTIEKNQYSLTDNSNNKAYGDIQSSSRRAAPVDKIILLERHTEEEEDLSLKRSCSFNRDSCSSSSSSEKETTDTMRRETASSKLGSYRNEDDSLIGTADIAADPEFAEQDDVFVLEFPPAPPSPITGTIVEQTRPNNRQRAEDRSFSRKDRRKLVKEMSVESSGENLIVPEKSIASKLLKRQSSQQQDSSEQTKRNKDDHPKRNASSAAQSLTKKRLQKKAQTIVEDESEKTSDRRPKYSKKNSEPTPDKKH